MIKKIAIMEQTNSNYSIIADYYSEHYNELKLYVMSRSLPADEAEDIVQNTFVRLLRGDKMITPVTLPCFVYTIAKNLIIDYYRRKHKIEEYEHFLGASDWKGRYDVDGESVFSAQQTNEILERGIARLTEKRSKVYRLNLFEGMQVSEIAKSLNLGYKAAENRLTLARKEIRDYMKKELAS
jgi:RNA polymerase sigma factor (sigma-70 family)